MPSETAKVQAWREKTGSSIDSVREHIGVSEPLLSLNDQVFSSQEPKLENISGPGSEMGSAVEDLGMVDQEAHAQVQEESKYKAQEYSGDIVNPHPLEVTCPSQEEDKEGFQDPEDRPGCASPMDVLLSTVGGLKTSETALLNATAVKLTMILQEQKADLKDKVCEIVERVYWEISSIPVGKARRAALNVVTSLAEVSPEDVVSSLLKYSLPCNSTASEMWKSLCTVPETNTKVVWHLLRELKRRATLPEQGCSAGDGAGHEEWLAPLAAARALGEMFKLFTCVGAMRGFYPAIFLAFLTQIHFLVRLPAYRDDLEEEKGEEEEEGQTHKMLDSGGKEGRHHSLCCKHVLAGHVRFAVETLKTLMLRDHNEKALLWMEKRGCWGLLSSKGGHLEGVLLLARILVTHTRHHVMGLLAEVIPQLCAKEEERALTAKALFAGFLCSKIATQLIPKRSILSRLGEWQADAQPAVRWLSLRGFENMALHRQKLKQLEALLSAILGGLDEAHEKTVGDTLQALGRILGCHQRRVCVGSMLVLIAEKLRPLLEDERERVRSLAIGLFGKLLLGVRLRHRAQMREQVLTHSVPFLLRLHDSSQEVVENCEWTLARCSDFLGWDLLEEIVILAHYDSQEALDKICTRLVRWYPHRVPAFLSRTLDYLKSPEAPLRRAAGVLAGFLAFHMDARRVSQEAMAALQCGLDCLLADSEPSIPEAASVSILQVKWARRRASASTLPLPAALARMLCCVLREEGEKPQFEDSPFKRKRSLEAFMSPPKPLL
ncbi:maestro heat-like repeat-containing protein family member 6 [Candoia aspera]|uniref:maestro heat-like repeat-containing protein family member 6 n=1 Tax=Candoia aspera TaxID=51853 RepID=UPI002FD87A89